MEFTSGYSDPGNEHASDRQLRQRLCADRFAERKARFDVDAKSAERVSFSVGTRQRVSVQPASGSGRADERCGWTFAADLHPEWVYVRYSRVSGTRCFPG